MNRRTIVSAFAAAVLMAAPVGALAFAPAAFAAADTQPPTVPTNVVVANTTPAQVTVVWGAATDDVAVTGYDVFRANGLAAPFTSVGTVTGTSFTDTGLASSSLYRYQVRARDAAGNVSAFSPAAIAVTPGPCTTPPPSPNNLTVLAFSSTSVSLRWTIVVPSFGCSPAGFDVLRAPGAAGGTFIQVAQTGLADTFVDSTVAPNTTYRYQVRARSANGLLSGPSNTVQVTTPDGCTPPLPMGSLTITSAAASSVSLSWVGPTNPACFAYDILRAPATSDGTFTQVGATNGLSFTDTGLSPGTTYRYMVRGRIVPNGNPWGTTNVALATTAPQTSGCAATYYTVGAWDGAFQGRVTVTNTGADALNGWQVTLTLPGTARLTQIWGGRTSQTASPYTITNENWNGTLEPNTSTTVGFQATINGTAAGGTVACTAG
jgi:endo-1,4-beta-xylanase